MTYIELVNRFWELDEYWQFSCCETRLYFYLLKTANRLGWEDEWKRSDTMVSSDIGVSVKVFKCARNRLVESGLIDVIQGNGRGNKSIYSIKGVLKGMQYLPPLRRPLNDKGIHKGMQYLPPLGTPLQEIPPIPPKEVNKTKIKTKKEPPKGGKKESSLPGLFPNTLVAGIHPGKLAFSPPDIDEVRAYFLSMQAETKLDDWEKEAAIFFNHFDSIGWRNANGVKIERWESKANLWILDHTHKKMNNDARGTHVISQTSGHDEARGKKEVGSYSGDEAYSGSSKNYNQGF